MATTVVSCALRYDKAVIAHVGDSRCYHLRGNKILAVTDDHTFVNEQLRMGLITPMEAASSEIRNILTRSLGPERFVKANVATLSMILAIRYCCVPTDSMGECTNRTFSILFRKRVTHRKLPRSW